MFRLEFDRAHSYGSQTDGITLPIVLRSGRAAAWLNAKVDTGASHCLFERGQGELLGLNIEAGDRKFFSTVTGQVETFGHIVMRTKLSPKPCLDARVGRFTLAGKDYQDGSAQAPDDKRVAS